jgi:hypothetical protein
MNTAHETIVPSADILNSWKEIAIYLNRGVRTVQRWEAELGMPVRRPRGRGRSAVIAVRTELDHWIKSCPLEDGVELKSRGRTCSLSPLIAQLRTSTLQLHQLRRQIIDSRAQLVVALSQLAANVGKVTQISGGVQRTELADMLAPPNTSTAA